MSYSQKFILIAILLESFTTERSTNELVVKIKLVYDRQELLKHSQ